MIPLMKHAFLNEQATKKALAEFILNSSQLSMSNKCFEFEREFAKKQKRADGILFNSGASANLALLQAYKNLGVLKEGCKIGFSALTWSTNIFPIIQMGFKPVPIDCSIETLNVTSETLKDRIKETEIGAFFATNVLGFTGDLKKIASICKENNILFFEDNCESLGTESEGIKAGNFGSASTFSFFVAHHMSTIEGGMVCTDDTELAEMLRIVRANGWDRNLTVEQQIKWRKKHNISSEFQAKYTFYDLGFNLRPTEITGFLGLYQMQFLDENIAIREKNYLEIEKVILKNDDLLPPKHDHISKLSTFAVPIVCKTPELRKRYLDQFSGAGIEIRPMIAGNIQKQPFYSKYTKETFHLPGTDFLHDNGFYCGNYPELTEMDLNTIKSCLYKY